MIVSKNKNMMFYYEFYSIIVTRNDVNSID